MLPSNKRSQNQQRSSLRCCATWKKTNLHNAVRAFYLLHLNHLANVEVLAAQTSVALAYSCCVVRTTGKYVYPTSMHPRSNPDAPPAASTAARSGISSVEPVHQQANRVWGDLMISYVFTLTRITNHYIKSRPWSCFAARSAASWASCIHNGLALEKCKKLIGFS